MYGQIFISYRRADTSWAVTSLHNSLLRHFPENQIFRDIDTIPPGEDFVDVLEEAVSKCDVLIAVIGKDWLGFTNKRGERALDNPSDFVRIEIATALKRKIRVIPVLIDNTIMPSADELPDDLKPLARRNAVELSNHRFNSDAERLIKALNKILDEAKMKVETEALEKQKMAAKERAQLLWQKTSQVNSAKSSPELSKQEEANWAKAVKINSLFSYNEYLKNYPNGKFLSEAKNAINNKTRELRGRL